MNKYYKTLSVQSLQHPKYFSLVIWQALREMSYKMLLTMLTALRDIGCMGYSKRYQPECPQGDNLRAPACEFLPTTLLFRQHHTNLKLSWRSTRSASPAWPNQPTPVGSRVHPCWSKHTNKDDYSNLRRSNYSQRTHALHFHRQACTLSICIYDPYTIFHFTTFSNLLFNIIHSKGGKNWTMYR